MAHVADIPAGPARDKAVNMMLDYADRCPPEDIRVWASALSVEHRDICTRMIRGKRMFADVMAGRVADASGIVKQARG